MTERRLTWPGTWNVRDLGGVEVPGGHIRPRRLVRSAGLHRLDDDGWSSVCDAGVRTVIDLRSGHEVASEPYEPPFQVERLPRSLEDGLAGDPTFVEWQQRDWLGTPLYYTPFLARFRDRADAVLTAIVDAPPGAVCIHCSAGWDRTGMIVAMVLATLGATLATARADYLESEAETASDAAMELGIGSRAERVAEVTAAAGTTLDAAFRAFYEAERAHALGRTDDLAERLRHRLVVSPT